MAAQDYVGKFVPSDEQLRRAELHRCEFAFFAAKCVYWKCRGGLQVADALSEAYAGLVKAIEEGDRSVADQVLRRWGVRGSPLASPLSRRDIRHAYLPTRSYVEASAVDKTDLGRLL